MPKKSKREMELEKQVEELNEQMASINANHRRLSHVTGTVVNEMLAESKTHQLSAAQELSEKARAAKREELAQRERLLHTKEQLQMALKELDSHIHQTKDVRFLSCGSNTCSAGCGKPPGKQVRNYLFCSTRSYDAYEEAAFDHHINPHEHMHSYEASPSEHGGGHSHEHHGGHSPEGHAHKDGETVQ